LRDYLQRNTLEPEWRGKITIEISNTTPLPAKIYANEESRKSSSSGRIARAVSAMRQKGKYQDQKGLTLPIVSGSMRARTREAHQL